MTNLLSGLIADLGSQMLLAVGVLAFVVSAITEVIKGLPLLNKIPTDIVVLVLSIFLTVISVVAYAQYSSVELQWYYIAAALIGSFFVSFVAMYGWSKLKELWGRFNPNK